MTYHLAGFQLHSVGERSARFTELHLDFTAPGSAMASAPADSVVWLRNGGGKSSLLSLFYALVLPRANDFLGRVAKRSLTDYIDTGDTAHTIAVWHPAVTETLDGAPDRVLVTGAVYEWAGLRRPADADRARDQLHPHYYAFYALPGVLEPDRLPITDESGAPLRQQTYLAALREAAAAHPQMTDLLDTNRQHEWTTALRNRDLDPDLFRTQKQMNHVEGGVEEMFRFASAREFVDLLIDLTVAPEDPDNVARRLSSIASLLLTKPAKTTEREFCLEAATGLTRVDVAQRETLDARRAADEAFDEASTLAAAFAATQATTKAQIDSIAGSTEEAEKKRSAADQQQGIAYDLLYLYQLHAARLRLDAAAEAHEEANEAIQNATELVAAWDAAGHLATKKRLESALQANAREATEEHRRTAPQRREHDEHAARLRRRLSSLADGHDAEAKSSRDAAASARDEEREHRDEAERYRGEVREADKAAATTKASLDALDDDLAAAVQAGALPSTGTDPRRHDTTLAEQSRGLNATLEEIRTRRKARPATRKHLSTRQAEIATEHGKQEAERARIAADHATLSDRAQALAGVQRVRDLTEAVEDAPVDLWAEAAILIRRLTDEIVNADVALVRHEAQRMEDRRTVDTQARTGLLPSTLDADRVQSILSDHGIDSETGWTHLLSVVSDVKLDRLLKDPELTRVGMGVVVATSDADDAAFTLMGVEASTTALVGVYTAHDASILARSDANGATDVRKVEPVWTGLHEGLVYAAIAEAAVQRIQAHGAERDQERSELTSGRDTDRRLLDALTRFLADCPAGHLAGLAQQVVDLDRALADLEESATAIQARLGQLEVADEADAELERDTTRQLTAIERNRAVLSGLMPKANAAARWRRDLNTAVEASNRAADAASLRETERAKAGTAAAEHGATAIVEESSAREYRTEATRIHVLDRWPDVVDNHSVLLDSLRAIYDEAERAWQARAAQSVLAERERNLRTGITAEVEALRPVPESIRDRAAELLRSNRGQTVPGRDAALSDARAAERAASTDLGRTESEVTQREEDLRIIRGRRAEPPRRSLPVGPGTADEADMLAAEQEAIGQAAIEQRSTAERTLDELRQQETQLDGRITTFNLLADGLPQVGDRVSPPFAGDESAARERKRVIVDRLQAAHQHLANTTEGRTRAIGDLRAVGGRFQSVATPAKDRIMHDHEDTVAQHAESLTMQLRLRAEMIGGELAGIAKDQAIVTDSLAHLVSNTLDTLRKAERYSRVVTRVGGWSGKQILRIGFTAPASEADLRTYIDRVIERRIEARVKPEGLPLLKDAVHEAVAPAGFRVKVLKPTLDVVSTTEDITRLGKWSGGEKLTVCVALYCTIAALRAANSGHRDRSGGVLLLDNPIGRASHGSLVELQRAVATAHRVQLVYTTGVKDPDAVSRFPNVVRLDNRPGRTRNRRYIVAEPNDHEDDRSVLGVRVAHAEPAPEADQ